MILEKDVAVPVRDGHKLYANVFRPPKEGKYPVIVAADCYGKDSIHLEFAKNIGYTLGGYDRSARCAEEREPCGRRARRVDSALKRAQTMSEPVQHCV